MSQEVLWPDEVEWSDDRLADWRGKAHVAVAKLAKTGKPFSVTDVWDLVGEKPSEPRHMGAVMVSAKADGLIESLGAQVTRSALRKRGLETRWRGTSKAKRGRSAS